MACSTGIRSSEPGDWYNQALEESVSEADLVTALNHGHISTINPSRIQINWPQAPPRELLHTWSSMKWNSWMLVAMSAAPLAGGQTRTIDSVITRWCRVFALKSFKILWWRKSLFTDVWRCMRMKCLPWNGGAFNEWQASVDVLSFSCEYNIY